MNALIPALECALHEMIFTKCSLPGSALIETALLDIKLTSLEREKRSEGMDCFLMNLSEMTEIYIMVMVDRTLEK